MLGTIPWKVQLRGRLAKLLYIGTALSMTCRILGSRWMYISKRPSPIFRFRVPLTIVQELVRSGRTDYHAGT